MQPAKEGPATVPFQVTGRPFGLIKAAETHTPHKHALSQQKGRFPEQRPSPVTNMEAKYDETLFHSLPLVKDSRSHYCASLVEGLGSLGPVCIPLRCHHSAHISKCFLWNTKGFSNPEEKPYSL